MERELPLYVPTHARPAITQYMLQAGQAHSIELHARYFDTADRQLAQSGIALRLRKEGAQWVQTLKAPGSDLLSRLELNHPRPHPELDLSLYAGTPVESALAQLSDRLILRYETRVTRLVAQAHVHHTHLEIAFDSGSILAGKLKLPISEVEFELVSGDMDTLFEVSQDWMQAYDLILETRSKSHRGDALASIAHAPQGKGKQDIAPGIALAQARHAHPVKMDKRTSMPALYQAYAGECLMQIAANAALLAGVDAADATPQQKVEYVHQLRIGIRRLRSCQQVFRPWGPTPDPALTDRLKQFFAVLGQSRDADVIQHDIAPLLIKAGLPCQLDHTDPAPPHATATIQLVRSSDFQGLLLQLLRAQLALTDTAPAVPFAHMPHPHRHLARRLDTQVRNIAKAGSHLCDLSIDDQHALRKKAKALRYNLDACQALLPGKTLKPIRKTLGKLQNVLGDLNDYYLAEAHYRYLTQTHPQAWFAVGWLRARQQQCRLKAQKVFKRLKKQRLLKR